jgi:putative RNA 2'-phosphotransferase
VLTALGVERAALDELLAAPGKRRFEISGGSIRALHGHSIDVEIDHAPAAPPELLFHGTALSRLSSIARRGLVRGERTHVQISESREEARETGARYGEPVVVEVLALALSRDHGAKLLRVPGSTVWLVDAVPVEYLVIPSVRKK